MIILIVRFFLQKATNEQKKPMQLNTDSALINWNKEGLYDQSLSGETFGLMGSSNITTNITKLLSME